MTTFQDFCRDLAFSDSDLTPEDVEARINSRMLIAWAEAEYRTTPHQLVADLLDDVSDFHARLLVNAILSREPQTDAWRILHDAAHARCVKDTRYYAEREREEECERRACDEDDRGDWLYEQRKDRQLMGD